MWTFFPVLCLVAPAFAQIALPQPPFLPPDAASGAQPSAGGIPNPQWSTLLGNLLYFYEAQRSGKLPSTKRVPWRNDSLVTDGQTSGVDLSGGYYDAGNYIKATYPLSFVVTSLCWGALDFGKGYDMANQTPYLDDMLRWSLSWLMKAHPANSTLYVMVSDDAQDNVYWGGDQNIPLSRPAFQINNTAPGTDAAAAASAAFSACSSLYAGHGFEGSFSGPASLQDSTYASTLLTHAQQLYTFAANATGGQVTYQTSVTRAADSYPSTSFGDELVLAALFLSWAENSPERYQEATAYYQLYKLSGLDVVFNWDSKTPGLAVLFAQVAQSPSGLGGNLSSWQTEAETYFDRIVNQKGLGHLTPGGLLFYAGDSDQASLNPALNAAMLFTRYAPMATTSAKKTSYMDFAMKQVDYVLGKNPMSAPYIVGSNPNSPSNPHSAMASGGSDIGHIDTSPPQEAYVIYGAVVGGPDQHDNFQNVRSNWTQTEVALDYNAPMLTLAAMHVLNDTNDPFFTSLQGEVYKPPCPGGTCITPGGTKPTEPADGSSELAKDPKIAIAVVVTVVGLMVIILATWYLCRCQSRRKKAYLK